MGTATTTFVPVSEYLRTTYRPDCDYVDGELRERNVGEEAHAEIQAILARILGNRRQEWNVRVLTEVRVQTSADHYRISDVCLVSASEPRGRVISQAPVLCVEILSRDDRFSDLETKVADFAAMGVHAIWVVDPWKRVGYNASSRGVTQPEDGMLRVPGTPIAVSIAELFAELDAS